MYLVLVEGEVAAEECEEYDSTGPNISTAAHVVLGAEYLWRGVVGTATTGCQTLAVPHEVAQSEINDFNLTLVDQDVLRLQVPVRNQVLVAVTHACEYLFEVESSLLLTDFATARNQLEQLPPFDVLHHDQDVSCSVQHFVQFYYVRMTEKSQ